MLCSAPCNNASCHLGAALSGCCAPRRSSTRAPADDAAHILRRPKQMSHRAAAALSENINDGRVQTEGAFWRQVQQRAPERARSTCSATHLLWTDLQSRVCKQVLSIHKQNSIQHFSSPLVTVVSFFVWHCHPICHRGSRRNCAPTEIGWVTSHLAASSVVAPHPHLWFAKMGKHERAVLGAQPAIR